METIVILAAAGRGERLGGSRAKLWALAAGKPLIYHALMGVERAGAIDGVIVMTPPGEVETLQKTAMEWGFDKIVDVFAGGERRQDTIRIGLESLPGSCEIVAIHDARPAHGLSELFQRTVKAARRSGAATAAIEPVDTIIQVDEDESHKYLERNSLRAVQTPQAFKVNIIREAHARALNDGFTATDDAGLVLRIGRPVELVEGEAENFKITHPRDILRLDIMLAHT